MERTPTVYSTRPIKGWQLADLPFRYDPLFHGELIPRMVASKDLNRGKIDCWEERNWRVRYSEFPSMDHLNLSFILFQVSSMKFFV